MLCDLPNQYPSLATPNLTVTRYTELYVYLVAQCWIVIAKEKNVTWILPNPSGVSRSG
jgi:hypothetical protein